MNHSNMSLFDDQEWMDIVFAIEAVELIYLPFLILVGIAGNVVSIIVIFSSKLSEAPPNHYLASLSASDTTYLLGLLPIWLGKTELLTAGTDYWCYFVLFLLNCSSWLSSWSITALTVERFFVITHISAPLARSSVLRSRLIIFFLIPFPLLFNSHVFFMTGAIHGSFCSYLPKYISQGFYINIIDTIIVFALPVLLILGSNLAVFAYLWKHKSMRSNMFEDGVESRRHISMRLMLRQRQQLARILVVVPCVFLALNLPSYIIRLKHFWSDDMSITIADMLISEVALLLNYTNYATNFIVYSLASRNFRQALTRLCRRKMRKASEGFRTVITTRDLMRAGHRNRAPSHSRTNGNTADDYEQINPFLSPNPKEKHLLATNYSLFDHNASVHEETKV